MASFRAGQVFGAISQNLGLFAERAGEKERREADREWDLKLEEIRAKREGEREQRAIDRETGREERSIERETGREERSIEREGIRTAAETERYNASTAATAQYRSDTLEQGASEFDRSLEAKAEAALAKRLQEIEEQYQDQLEAAMGDDPEGRLMASMVDRRDSEIVSFVENMAMKGSPSYEGAMDSFESFKDAVGRNGIRGDAAEFYGKQLFPPPAAEPDPNPFQTSVPAHIPDPNNPGGVISNPAIMDGGAGGNTAAAPMPGRQIDMVKPGQTPSTHPRGAMGEREDRMKQGVSSLFHSLPGVYEPPQQSGGGGR